MNETYKEKLSQHVEGIFKGYTLPGLHICDIAAYSGDTRSAIPVIPVHSVVDFQYRRQN